MNAREFHSRSALGLLLATTLALAGCATGGGPYAHVPSRPHARSASCPLHVDLTTVHAEDVDGGTALVFATRTDVVLLRQRVARMVDRHLRNNLLGGLESRADESGGAPERQPLRVPSHARAENLGRGARIVFTPDDPSELDALRREVRARASRMTSPTCRPTPAAVASAGSVRRQ